MSVTKKDLSLNSRFSSDNLHFDSKFSVNNLNLKNKIEDFYRTDNISKSSKILLKCSNNIVLTNYI